MVLDSPAIEVLAKQNPNQIKSDVAEAQQRQQQLVSELESVLSKNPEQTLAVLRNVYGLGSYDPSYFAIYMVGELHLSQACPDLERHLLDEIAGEKLATQIRAVRHQLCGRQ